MCAENSASICSLKPGAVLAMRAVVVLAFAVRLAFAIGCVIVSPVPVASARFFAQRAFCAALILLRPAADIFLFAGMVPGVVVSPNGLFFMSKSVTPRKIDI